MVGPDLLFVTQHPLHRARFAIILTSRGRELVTEIDKALS